MIDRWMGVQEGRRQRDNLSEGNPQVSVSDPAIMVFLIPVTIVTKVK